MLPRARRRRRGRSSSMGASAVSDGSSGGRTSLGSSIFSSAAGALRRRRPRAGASSSPSSKWGAGAEAAGSSDTSSGSPTAGSCGSDVAAVRGVSVGDGGNPNSSARALQRSCSSGSIMVGLLVAIPHSHSAFGYAGFPKTILTKTAAVCLPNAANGRRKPAGFASTSRLTPAVRQKTPTSGGIPAVLSVALFPRFWPPLLSMRIANSRR